MANNFNTDAESLRLWLAQQGLRMHKVTNTRDNVGKTAEQRFCEFFKWEPRAPGIRNELLSRPNYRRWLSESGQISERDWKKEYEGVWDPTDRASRDARPMPLMYEIYHLPRGAGKTKAMDEVIRKQLASKMKILTDTLTENILMGRMTQTEKGEMAGMRSRIERLSSELGDERNERSREVIEKNRTINDQRAKIETLEKELSAERSENLDLRENLQRAFGYIDRVNEDDCPPRPAAIEPERLVTRERGPKLRPLGRGYQNDINVGSQISGMSRRY